MLAILSLAPVRTKIRCISAAQRSDMTNTEDLVIVKEKPNNLME